MANWYVRCFICKKEIGREYPSGRDLCKECNAKKESFLIDLYIDSQKTEDE